MGAVSGILSKYPELAVFFSLGIGYWIGGFKFRGFTLGGVIKRISFVRALGCSMLAAVALAETACGPSPKPSDSAATAPGEWREFEGSWNASGSRRTISLGMDRKGSIIDLRGSMPLAGSGRPGVGFRSDVIALVDSETGLVGRSVWVDENGDQVFSELKGEGTAAKNRIFGAILGGTGRYAGITGNYEFTWQFVMEAEDGAIQGNATALKGKFRIGQPSAGSANP